MHHAFAKACTKVIRIQAYGRKFCYKKLPMRKKTIVNIDAI